VRAGVGVDVGVGVGALVAVAVGALVAVAGGRLAEGGGDDAPAAAKAATQPRESTGVVQSKVAACVPAAALRTSSLTMVPVRPLAWARSVAGAPPMAPASALTPLFAFIAPANTSDPAGTGPVDDVVSVESSEEMEQVVATGGEAATPEYSARDARIAPRLEEVTVSAVAPARASVRYQTDSIPSEPASNQAPLRLSETFGPDGARTMATKRSPRETGCGSAAERRVPDPSTAAL
jgi:hypothetical protein